MCPQIVKASELESFISKHPELIVHDHLDLAIEELFDIDFPAKKDTKDKAEIQAYAKTKIGTDIRQWGEWVYYPWLNELVHTPPKEHLRALRTSRNRNLITSEEQSKLYNATILVVGMSVGSNVVEALVSQGIGGKLILVDMDIVEPTNLNRIRSPYHHVGLHKVEAISRKVWEIDPYIEIIDIKDGLTEQNLETTLEKHKIDIVIDEMDSLRMKIILREAARSYQLPVIMAADDGDNALLDIERYDLNPDLSLFGGKIPAEIITHIKQANLSRAEVGMMIGKYFVGVDNTPLRMFQSLAEVGKTLPSWPQLGGAAALSGICLAYLSRKIILGEKIQDGRILISLDEKLDLEHDEPAHKTELTKYKQQIGNNSHA